MIRALLDEALLFLVPFALFALLLVARRRNPFQIEHWTNAAFRLTVAGLVLVIVSILVGAVLEPAHTGPFEPAHMENGRLVPGRFK